MKTIALLRRFLLACLLWLGCGSAWGQVARDACASAAQNNVSGTSFTSTQFTVGSASNRALVVTVAFAGATSAQTATWDSGGTNQAMSVHSTNGGLTVIFTLVAPTSGNKTLSVSWTTARASTVDGC